MYGLLICRLNAYIRSISYINGGGAHLSKVASALKRIWNVLNRRTHTIIIQPIHLGNRYVGEKSELEPFEAKGVIVDHDTRKFIDISNSSKGFTCPQRQGEQLLNDEKAERLFVLLENEESLLIYRKPEAK